MNSKFLFCIAGLLFSSFAQAALVNIVNAGFEDNYFGSNLPEVFNGVVPATAFPVGPAPNGWNAYGSVGGSSSIGILNPGTLENDGATFFTNGAAEGNNVALTFNSNEAGGAEFGIEQILTASLQANTQYILSFAIGNIASGISTVAPFSSFGSFDLNGFPGYRVDLLAGGVVIASDNNTLLPNEGEFIYRQISATIGVADALIGQTLGIRLVNLNRQDQASLNSDLEVDFDDIRLDALATIPLPASAWFMLTALLLFMLFRKTQDNRTQSLREIHSKLNAKRLCEETLKNTCF